MSLQVSLELFALEPSLDQLVVQQRGLSLKLGHFDIVLGLQRLECLAPAIKLALQVLLLLLERSRELGHVRGFLLLDAVQLIFQLSLPLFRDGLIVGKFVLQERDRLLFEGNVATRVHIATLKSVFQTLVLFSQGCDFLLKT